MYLESGYLPRVILSSGDNNTYFDTTLSVSEMNTQSFRLGDFDYYGRLTDNDERAFNFTRNSWLIFDHYDFEYKIYGNTNPVIEPFRDTILNENSHFLGETPDILPSVVSGVDLQSTGVVSSLKPLIKLSDWKYATLYEITTPNWATEFGANLYLFQDFSDNTHTVGARINNDRVVVTLDGSDVSTGQLCEQPISISPVTITVEDDSTFSGDTIRLLWDGTDSKLKIIDDVGTWECYSPHVNQESVFNYNNRLKVLGKSAWVEIAVQYYYDAVLETYTHYPIKKFLALNITFQNSFQVDTVYFGSWGGEHRLYENNINQDEFLETEVALIGTLSDNHIVRTNFVKSIIKDGWDVFKGEFALYPGFRTGQKVQTVQQDTPDGWPTGSAGDDDWTRLIDGQNAVIIGNSGLMDVSASIFTKSLNGFNASTPTFVYGIDPETSSGVYVPISWASRPSSSYYFVGLTQYQSGITNDFQVGSCIHDRFVDNDFLWDALLASVDIESYGNTYANCKWLDAYALYATPEDLGISGFYDTDLWTDVNGDWYDDILPNLPGTSTTVDNYPLFSGLETHVGTGYIQHSGYRVPHHEYFEYQSQAKQLMDSFVYADITNNVIYRATIDSLLFAPLHTTDSQPVEYEIFNANVYSLELNTSGVASVQLYHPDRPSQVLAVWPYARNASPIVTLTDGTQETGWTQNNDTGFIVNLDGEVFMNASGGIYYYEDSESLFDLPCFNQAIYHETALTSELDIHRGFWMHNHPDYYYRIFTAASDGLHMAQFTIDADIYGFVVPDRQGGKNRQNKNIYSYVLQKERGRSLEASSDSTPLPEQQQYFLTKADIFLNDDWRYPLLVPEDSEQFLPLTTTPIPLKDSITRYPYYRVGGSSTLDRWDIAYPGDVILGTLGSSDPEITETFSYMIRNGQLHIFDLDRQTTSGVDIKTTDQVTTTDWTFDLTAQILFREELANTLQDVYVAEFDMPYELWRAMLDPGQSFTIETPQGNQDNAFYQNFTFNRHNDSKSIDTWISSDGDQIFDSDEVRANEYDRHMDYWSEVSILGGIYQHISKDPAVIDSYNQQGTAFSETIRTTSLWTISGLSAFIHSGVILGDNIYLLVANKILKCSVNFDDQLDTMGTVIFVDQEVNLETYVSTTGYTKTFGTKTLQDVYPLYLGVDYDENYVYLVYASRGSYPDANDFFKVKLDSASLLPIELVKEDKIWHGTVCHCMFGGVTYANDNGALLPLPRMQQGINSCEVVRTINKYTIAKKDIGPYKNIQYGRRLERTRLTYEMPFFIDAKQLPVKPIIRDLGLLKSGNYVVLDGNFLGDQAFIDFIGGDDWPTETTYVDKMHIYSPNGDPPADIKTNATAPIYGYLYANNTYRAIELPNAWGPYVDKPGWQIKNQDILTDWTKDNSYTIQEVEGAGYIYQYVRAPNKSYATQTIVRGSDAISNGNWVLTDLGIGNGQYPDAFWELYLNGHLVTNVATSFVDGAFVRELTVQGHVGYHPYYNSDTLKLYARKIPFYGQRRRTWSLNNNDLDEATFFEVDVIGTYSQQYLQLT